MVEELISQQSRGDKTAIELFRQGMDGWDASLRRPIDDGKSKFQ